MRKVCMECYQEIPCNPCVDSCPVNAISMEKLTALPKANLDKCIGCGNCVAVCPGQACFLIDKDYNETKATLDFPFEFLPCPKEGEKVIAVDRNGKPVCEAEVVRVITKEAFDKTKVIRIALPKEHSDTVRYIQLYEEKNDEKV